MRSFVETADAVGATTKKTEKVRLIGDFFRSLDLQDAVLAARFLSGHAFAGHDERTLGVGGSVLSRLIAQAAGRSGENLATTYRKHGDLGDMAEELLLGIAAEGEVPLAEIGRLFEEVAGARVQMQKAELL